MDSSVLQPDFTTLYDFLKKNREFPIFVQRMHREINLIPFNKTEDKAYSLMHNTYYTQSVAKMDNAIKFFQPLLKHKRNLSSFKGFCDFLGCNVASYQSVFQKLTNDDGNGWGKKTTALLLKNIHNIHYYPELSHLKFWGDVPKNEGDDELYIPVDAVIKDIMVKIDENLNNFKKINNALKPFGRADVWDDLWFWGFITQKSNSLDNNRMWGFNDGKYWSDLVFPKDDESIKDIKNRCEVFIGILCELKKSASTGLSDG